VHEKVQFVEPFMERRVLRKRKAHDLFAAFEGIAGIAENEDLRHSVKIDERLDLRNELLIAEATNHSNSQMSHGFSFLFPSIWLSVSPMMLAGMPTATFPSGISLSTSVSAPMIALSPMVTPGITTELTPIKTLSPIETSLNSLFPPSFSQMRSEPPHRVSV